MNILILFLMLLSSLSQARDFEGMSINDIFLLEEFSHGQPKDRNLEKKNNISDDLISKTFNDHLNLVNPEFKTPQYFFNNAFFWYRIYSQYSSHHVVLHDKTNLNLVYTVLDFSDIKSSIENSYTASNLQTYLTSQKTLEYKRILTELSQGCTKSHCLEISNIIKKSGIIMPKTSTEQKKFYLNLLSNIRGQTGQRDRVHEGLLRFLPYDDFFTFYLKAFNLPYELSAIPFLESSFNFQAYSKVAARGVWQIMPYISKKLFPTHKDIDYRVSPIISTIGALHLLKQNKSVVKRWDLAVTAYNSGTRHIIAASKKLSVPLADLALEYIFQNYSHPHLGFASQNFYSEFLAISKVLDYKDQLFAHPQTEVNMNKNVFDIYLLKCSKSAKDLSPLIHSELNLHLNLKQKRPFPKGTIIASNSVLSSQFFFKVESSIIVKQMPLQWMKLIKNQSCSTR
jgi:membrane-bound lytic murein transglycosylase D